MPRPCIHPLCRFLVLLGHKLQEQAFYLSICTNTIYDSIIDIIREAFVLLAPVWWDQSVQGSPDEEQRSVSRYCTPSSSYNSWRRTVVLNVWQAPFLRTVVLVIDSTSLHYPAAAWGALVLYPPRHGVGRRFNICYSIRMVTNYLTSCYRRRILRFEVSVTRSTRTSSRHSRARYGPD